MMIQVVFWIVIQSRKPQLKYPVCMSCLIWATCPTDHKFLDFTAITVLEKLKGDMKNYDVQSNTYCLPEDIY